MKTHLQVATWLAHLLETRFNIGRFRFGLDPIMGLVPGLGDVVSFLLSYYIVWIGHRMNLPKDAIAKMYRNVLFDFMIGLIPIAGDAIDFLYKANTKNLEILKQYANQTIIEGEIAKT